MKNYLKSFVIEQNNTRVNTEYSAGNFSRPLEFEPLLFLKHLTVTAKTCFGVVVPDSL